MKELVARAQPGDTIALLSNGAFGGIYAKLLSQLTSSDQEALLLGGPGLRAQLGAARARAEARARNLGLPTVDGRRRGISGTDTGTGTFTGGSESETC